ncbi:MAG: ATP-binding protein [Acidobacteriota bacterium]
MSTVDHSARDAFGAVLERGGAMGALVARFAWSTTPLGPLSHWPSSLKNTVATVLHSRHPMFLWWGPELIQIYNDAYVPSFGAGKHPAALGQRGCVCWPEIWDIIGPQIDAVMQRGEPSWHEDALVPIFRNGTVEDVYWTYGYSPVFDDDARIGGVLVVCTETTARVTATKAEVALRETVDRARQRLAQFFAQAPAGICVVSGPSLTFESANDAYRELVGGREIVGLPLLEALPELAGQGLDTLLHGVRSTGEPVVGREVRLQINRRGYGTAEDRYFTFIYSPIRDAMARVDAVIVLALDVTDEVIARRDTEALTSRLQESEAQFHLLAESIPQLAWATRPDGHIDWYNQRWYDYTGTTLEQMQGWGWKSVHDPDRVDEVVTRWQDALASGAPFEMNFALRGRDGVFRWHLTRAVPLRDQAGRIVRWFGTNTDIDAQRRAEVERATLLANEQRARHAAELASRAKDEFLATASHELRTPLNAILGWARMLQTGQLDHSVFLRAIDSIQRNAAIQVRLIEDILDGSRIITGQLHLEIRTLDLAMLVSATLEAVRTAADAKNITVSLSLDPQATLVVGDPDRLQQVMWNLMVNAIKFTAKGGTVEVSLRRVDTSIELQVSDNGEGISPEFLPHVFERFRQAQASTTRRHGGLGLGLALVRHLVEAHGGTVSADSAGVGQGAAFTVTLPVQAVFAESVAMTAPPRSSFREFVPSAASLTGVSVLVVDDELDARDLVATALRAKGAEVTSAASAAEALELVAARAFMAMVSDIGMPDTDGYALIRRIRTTTGARGVHLPAVALTAYSREEDRRRALDAGYNAYVSKPVDPEELVQIVAGIVTTALAQSGEVEEGVAARAHTIAKFKRVLAQSGVHAALQFLNSRTAHRFTGIYRFDPPILRNLLLLDADLPAVVTGEDAPMEATYCSIVGAFERPFTTEDTLRDDRLRGHVARESIRSYCGVLLRRPDGQGFGTLCHFDLVPCDVPVAELALMEMVAPLIMDALAEPAAATPG